MNNFSPSPELQLSIQLIQEIFEERGYQDLCPSEKELYLDWGIEGGESYSDLKIYVNEFISDCSSEQLASKNQWRYEL
jgi:hypothetical protein